MQQATWFTRLGLLGSILGAILTEISIFLPLILTRPPLDARFSDPYPPMLDGVWLLRSLFSPHLLQSQTPNLATLAYLFAALLILGLLTLGADLGALLLPNHLSAVTSWVQTLAALGSLIVLLWFVAGIEVLNIHLLIFGPLALIASPGFSMGFGMVFLLVGTALGALGLGRVGIAAAVGAGIGFLLLLTPLALFAFLIGTITCILGALIGWWVQRAALKNAHALMMK